ncbi:hypothetical protein IWX49DRAFT_585688 [Phyllosticta citricarpa]
MVRVARKPSVSREAEVSAPDQLTHDRGETRHDTSDSEDQGNSDTRRDTSDSDDQSASDSDGDSDGDDDDDDDGDNATTIDHPYPNLTKHLEKSRWALDKAAFLERFDITAYKSRDFLRRLKSWVNGGAYSLDEACRAMEKTRKHRRKGSKQHRWTPMVVTATLEKLHAKGLETNVRILKDRRQRPEKRKPKKADVPDDSNGNAARECTPPVIDTARGANASLSHPSAYMVDATLTSEQAQSPRPNPRSTSTDRSNETPSAENQRTTTNDGSVKTGGRKRKAPVDAETPPSKRTRAGLRSTAGPTPSQSRRTRSKTTPQRLPNMGIPRPKNRTSSIEHARADLPVSEELGDASMDFDTTDYTFGGEHSPEANGGQGASEVTNARIESLLGTDDPVKDEADKPQGTELPAAITTESRDPGASLCSSQWVSASDMEDALTLFAPMHCRFLDSTVVDIDGTKSLPRPRLTINEHHKEAVLPILRNNHHWALAILDLQAMTGKVLDSFSTSTVVPPKVKSALVELGRGLFADQDWNICTAPTAQQPNTNDCGIYAIAAAIYHWYGNGSVLRHLDSALWRATMCSAVRTFRSPPLGEPEMQGALDFEQWLDEEVKTLLASNVEIEQYEDAALAALDKKLSSWMTDVIKEFDAICQRGGGKTLREMLSRSRDAIVQPLQKLEEELRDTEDLRKAFVEVRRTAQKQATTMLSIQNKARLENHGLTEIETCDHEIARLKKQMEGTKASVSAINAAIITSNDFLRRLKDGVEERREVGNKLKVLNVKVQEELVRRKNQLWNQWDDRVERGLVEG